MEIRGVRRHLVAKVIREGSFEPGDDAWLFENGLVDKHGEPEMKLYFEAIRNEILSVRYVVRVRRHGRPALILEEARVPDGPVTARTALSMIEHSIGFGLCGTAPVLQLQIDMGAGYRVAHS